MERYSKTAITHFVVINAQRIGGEHYDNRPELDNVRISGTYLHGNLESKAGFDIFSFVGNVPNYAGIYPAKVLTLSENATLFLWCCDHGRAHGLVVDNDDTIGLEYAHKQYNKRSIVI